ncbi:MAG: PQQ-dependent sugar dehydrogenase [Marinibacterium sp.]
MRCAVLFMFLMVAPIAGMAQSLTTSAGRVEVRTMVDGLSEPWAVGILPDGSFLVTERGGTLLYVVNGKARKVTGAPRVRAQGQGGLLDVTLARDFARTRTVFLSYSKAQPGGGAGTALAVARLSPNGSRLTHLRTIYEAPDGGTTGRHFGSRVVEALDGTLFLTIGDRGKPENAQDRSLAHGSIIRVNRDGTVPADNPFVGQPGIRPEIWSFGHRNPQGAGLDALGRLWTSEHGARGGDEVNLIQKGANYGWPVISYGVNYDGTKIGEGTAKPGMQQPKFYWDPSIAPSGLLVYSGKLWADWRGDIFVGSLKFDYISRLDWAPPREREKIKGPMTDRVRDIVEAPDGSIWFISVGRGAIYAMHPG